VPIPDPKIQKNRERIVLKGDVPSPLNPPHGCPFNTRCAYAFEHCSIKRPRLKEYAPGHHVACHLLNPKFAHFRSLDRAT